MKLRIPDNASTIFGTIQFVDGVSVRGVTPREANHLRAIMSGVVILKDDGETVDDVLNGMDTILPRGFYEDAGHEVPSDSLPYWDGTFEKVEYAPAECDRPAGTDVVSDEGNEPPEYDEDDEGDEDEDEDDSVQEDVIIQPEGSVVTDDPDAKFVRAELEAIADAEGIAGLRLIAEQHNVSGRSIAGIIDDLMKVK